MGTKVSHYLTGRDEPLLHMEWMLQQRYQQVTLRLQKQHGKGKRR